MHGAVIGPLPYPVCVWRPKRLGTLGLKQLCPGFQRVQFWTAEYHAIMSPTPFSWETLPVSWAKILPEDGSFDFDEAHLTRWRPKILPGVIARDSGATPIHY